MILSLLSYTHSKISQFKYTEFGNIGIIPLRQVSNLPKYLSYPFFRSYGISIISSFIVPKFSKDISHKKSHEFVYLKKFSSALQRGEKWQEKKT